MIEQEKINHYHRIAADIAETLGFAWQPSQPDDRDGFEEYVHRHQTMTDPAGREIVLSFDGWQNEGRFSVYGRYPRREDGREIQPRDVPKITISQERSPAAAATDIRRRFYSQFVTIHTEMQAVAEKDRANVEWVRQVARFFVQQFSGSVRDVGSPEKIVTTSAKVYIPGKANVEIRGEVRTCNLEHLPAVDAETAAAILELL